MNVSTHHAHFIVFLRKVMLDYVPERDHAPELHALTNGQVPESMAMHEETAGIHILLRRHGKSIFCHDFGYFRLTWVAALDYHTAHQIAL